MAVTERLVARVIDRVGSHPQVRCPRFRMTLEPGTCSRGREKLASDAFGSGPPRVERGQIRRKEEPMGDRSQRVKGKAEEVKGRAKRETGIAAGRPGTEARGAGEELKGKAKNAVGRARSAAKKATR